MSDPFTKGEEKTLALKNEWAQFANQAGFTGRERFASKYPYRELFNYVYPHQNGTFLGLVMDRGRVGLVAGQHGFWAIYYDRIGETDERTHSIRMLALLKGMLRQGLHKGGFRCMSCSLE